MQILPDFKTVYRRGFHSISYKLKNAGVKPCTHQGFAERVSKDNVNVSENPAEADTIYRSQI